MKLSILFFALITIITTAGHANDNYAFSSFDLIDLQQMAQKTNVNGDYSRLLTDSKKNAECKVSEKSHDELKKIDVLNFICRFDLTSTVSVTVTSEEMGAMFHTMNIPVIDASSIFALKDGHSLRCSNQGGGAFTCSFDH